MRNLRLSVLFVVGLSAAPAAVIAAPVHESAIVLMAPAAVAAPDDAGVTLISATADAPDAGTETPAPVVLPDPVESPVEAIGVVTKLWKGGTIPAALIVGLFFALVVASRKIPYLQTGRVAVVIAASIGGLTLLVEAASRGTTPNLAMIATALIAAVALYLNPKKPAADAEKKAAEVVA